MAIIDFRAGLIQGKIVYYGPGRGGKTTNLITIHKFLGANALGELLSIDTKGDRTLLFDFLPMDLGSIGKFRVKLSLYTVPGQVRYNDTRKLVLKGVDGVVFVADSLAVRQESNIESLLNLEENLREQGKDLGAVPVVLQYNKRDLESAKTPIMSLEALDADLNPHHYYKAFPASALRGSGVKETFKEICMLTVTHISKPFLRS